MSMGAERRGLKWEVVEGERDAGIQWDEEGEEKWEGKKRDIQETGNVKEDGRDRDGRGKNWVGERGRLRSVERETGFVS